MRFLGKRLPPLGTLVAFEAASRNLSFTKSAEELHLTQAAVSRQIRLLEEDLGVRLFVRANRTVALTPEGRDLQHTVALALAHIANASEQVRATGGGEHKLTVAADQSIATLWLMPRLADFRQLNPNTSIRLVVSDNDEDCLADHIDVSLVHGDGEWSGYDSTLLFGEDIFPVCSPAYLEQNGPIAEPGDLAHHVLLGLEDDHWNWMTWRIWLTEIGVHLPTDRPNMTINNYPLLLQAAAEGQGIALGWSHLADPYLADKRLISPLGPMSVTTNAGYHLLCPVSRPLSTDATLFRDWVMEIIAL